MSQSAWMSLKKNPKSSLDFEGDPYRVALDLALRKLRSQARFQSEIREFLKEFPEEVRERVIQFLLERRILDDFKTTQSLVERYAGKRAAGSEKIRAELQRRGARKMR